MQYVRNTIGSVSKTWNSINPSTLSGAIDVVVVERPSGELHCSAFHIRFGKFSLLRPTHKGVDFWVNDTKVDVQMKLGEGGEAFFVFETAADVPESMLTSPVISPAGSPRSDAQSDDEVDYLDLQQPAPGSPELNQSELEPKDVGESVEDLFSKDNHEWIKRQDPQKMDELLQRLSEVNIPSTQNDNGEVIIDMTGYKPSGQNTAELESVVEQILQRDLTHPLDPTTGLPLDVNLESSEYNEEDLEDDDVSGSGPPSPSIGGLDGATPPASAPRSPLSAPMSPNTFARKPKHFVKTLRLTSDMLKRLNLKHGRNSMMFKVRDSKATVTASIYYWQSGTPVVVSDIDGTITRSDALGHVMTMIGRDWTHQGVGKLFTDICRNGYNIMYLTSRAVGQADITRAYLEGIEQEGYRLPAGPVILSPDRTIAALHREVIMRKPEIFKMACLRDIGNLYDTPEDTPFYAGFGNRITDALSYRSVGVPSTKIFTINSNSEVHMELLELTGFKSSYMLISDLVDHFFPPYNQRHSGGRTDTTEFTDVNYWKVPVLALSDEEQGADENSDDEYHIKLNATFGTDIEDDEDDDYEDDYEDDDEEDEEDDDDEEDEYYEEDEEDEEYEQEDTPETVQSSKAQK